MKKTFYLLLLLLLASSFMNAETFTFRQGEDLTVVFGNKETEVVKTALEIFQKDYARVFKGEVKLNREKGSVYIGTLGQGSEAEKLADAADIQELRSREEGFLVVLRDGNLLVLGSDKRGTAYGILELSRIIGVSPWEWWADSFIEEKEKVTLDEGFRSLQSPSVKHRGIFLNDEDWGLTPWSYKTNEPSDIKGQIGPQTHARIFELLLRLRANTFWPAMHDCSVAFYMTPGNKEMADKYGIFIGTSHCEPMMRNTNAEWKLAGTGIYDYVNNRENVLKFWEERTAELAGSDNIYTLGIRGVHDSKMLGANTLQEQKNAIDSVLKDQRAMIAKYVNPNVEEVPQVFIPYKEVLDVYNMGLEVPEDVTLMWCDDNYGYIRHFPDARERARKGGNGVYYHVSYWGRPHDYLWLSTTHPALIYTQMKLAYDKGAREMWIVNVGDIKPAEYQIELFLDMAWDINGIENNIEGLDNHLLNWLKREFGERYADELLSVMNEYYRLAYIRKPEYMGNTRTEEKDPAYKVVTDLPWSEEKIHQRINEYIAIEDKVKQLSDSIMPQQQDTWFQLVEYPVRGASEMNKKHLYGQLARHGKADWTLSDQAYDTIVSLTEKYNSLANGKWRYIMDYQPRKLPVFDRVPRTQATTRLKINYTPRYLFNGAEYTVASKDDELVSHGLGYQRKAISLPLFSQVGYSFETSTTDSIYVEVALVPTHPVDGNTLRCLITIDGEAGIEEDFHTEGRSEWWKENVLRNQTIQFIKFPIRRVGEHLLTISAQDEGIVVDQIKIHMWD